jgi:hypothetical protein
MTGPAPVMPPASEAAHIRDLLSIAESLLAARRAHGERGSASVLASPDELARLLAGGLDASQLISEFADTHLQLTEMIARSPR